MFVALQLAGRPDRRLDSRTVWLGLLLTATGAVASLFLQGPYAAGAGIGDVLSGSLLSATLDTPFGRLLLLRLAALGRARRS